MTVEDAGDNLTRHERGRIMRDGLPDDLSPHDSQPEGGQPRRWKTWQVMTVGVFALFLGFGMGANSIETNGTEDAAAPQPAPTVTVVETVIPSAPPTTPPDTSETVHTWEGAGEFASEPFDLPSGAYLSEWTIDSDCPTYFWLSDPETGHGVEDIGSATGPHEGELTVYGVDAGTYYLNVLTSDPVRCTWSLRLTSKEL